jgi:hypothetical protein
MAKKKRKTARRRGDAFQRRMTRVLARHGLTTDQAGQLSDSDLRRHRGIGAKMIDAIRAAGGPAPTPSVTREGQAADLAWDAARDRRIVALERQVADLVAAVRQIQDLLRVRGIDRRAHPSGEDPAEEKSGPQEPSAENIAHK